MGYDKIIGLYAAGLSVRDIQAPLEDLYGLRVSAVSPMPCWTRSASGSTVHWTGCIRS